MIVKEKGSDDFMIEEVREAQSFEAHFIEEEYVKKFFERLNATLITSLASAGLGKSSFIKNKAKNFFYKRIPI